MEALRVIKKYPNRRLYDMCSKRYITLCEVKTLVLEQAPFQVIDARTQQDLTRCILMQIILEEELGKSPLFSCEMLSRMIRSYGNGMQRFLGHYLEQGLRYVLEHPPQDPAGTDLPAPYPASDEPSLHDLMGHHLDQITRLFHTLQQQGENISAASSLQNQHMSPVNGSHAEYDQPHLQG
ncbi:polyhydroxyalkanoate synthesis repressor PhaR [Ferrovum sp.]|jgi:polyhydroxyalkanoate synthesis repressor PhaR|uniref:polyhydroxyalkanoate synthesis repressor PhaR n=1 Tax=Ferrovum sp. TaxID=2609467 RepID=UPI0026357EDE|nr:polyhydroxyalkanoate synthesis repressor PhaR [Ferrovum sp.]